MQQRFRTVQAFPVAVGDVDTEIGLPVTMKKHYFQASVSVTLTPVLFSGADGTDVAIAAGETWATDAPLRGFKSDTAATIYWAGDIK